MNNNPFLTIIILTYNRKDDVLYSLDLISKNSFYPADRYEVIVVDNNSSDGTYNEVLEKFPSFKIIKLDKNLGLVGWNEGLKRGRGDYFLLLDDDSSPESGIDKAIEYMEENKEVGIVACNIVGGPFTIRGVEDKADTLGFINCGVLIRKNVIDRVGYFKEWMFMFANEWEYSIRVKNAGFRIVYLKDCIVKHRASLKNRSYKFLRTYTTRNELSTVWLYFLGVKKFVILFRVLFWNAYMFRIEGISSILYAFNGFFEFLKLIPMLNKEKTYVKAEILEDYELNFWSFKPILTAILKKLGFR